MYPLPESCSHTVREIAVAFVQIRCPSCQHTEVIQHGTTAQGTQRYRCKNPSCPQQTFLLEYRHYGRMPEVKQQILEMTLNGSGIRDIARVLHISPTTVIAELKKRAPASTRQRYRDPTYEAKRDPRRNPPSGRS
jgi:transposase-like protein